MPDSKLRYIKFVNCVLVCVTSAIITYTVSSCLVKISSFKPFRCQRRIWLKLDPDLSILSIRTCQSGPVNPDLSILSNLSILTCQSCQSCQSYHISHVIGFSDHVDLWVIKIKKPMILCARNTSRSREQGTKCRSHSENIRKVCLFYSQNNEIVWLSNMADTFFEKSTRCAKVCGLYFLDCAFRTLIGWAGKLQSHGEN